MMRQHDNVCLYWDPPASAELLIHIRHTTTTKLTFSFHPAVVVAAAAWSFHGSSIPPAFHAAGTRVFPPPPPPPSVTQPGPVRLRFEWRLLDSVWLRAAADAAAGSDGTRRKVVSLITIYRSVSHLRCTHSHAYAGKHKHTSTCFPILPGGWLARTCSLPVCFFLSICQRGVQCATVRSHLCKIWYQTDTESIPVHCRRSWDVTRFFFTGLYSVWQFFANKYLVQMSCAGSITNMIIGKLVILRFNWPIGQSIVNIVWVHWRRRWRFAGFSLISLCWNYYETNIRHLLRHCSNQPPPFVFVLFC